MSFLQPMLARGAAAGRAADHHPPDQPAAVPDDPLGGDDVPAGGQPDVAGYARLRQWLIMLFRMAAIATLIFAVSRPLAGGWLGLAGGGRASTTIILVDRSPSMQQEGALARTSKRETGLAQLVQALETLGSARWVLIDSALRQAARAGVGV